MAILDRLRHKTTDEHVGSMTVIEHLEELRHRLVVGTIAVAVAIIPAWFLWTPFLHVIQQPFCTAVHNLPLGNRPPTGCRLIVNGVVDALLVKLKVVIFLALFIAAPVLLWQLWAFIVPGLTRRERRLAVPFITSSMVLFAMGALVAYITLPKGLSWLLGFAGDAFVPLLTADRFIGFVVLLTLAFGVSFEFPILLIFLSLVGIISSAKMRAWRRWSILAIAIFAAVITPSSDPYTMLAMMIPMYVFYEAAIIVTRIMGK
jgi:sec-independent protein translocase protein TatC